MYTVVLGAVGAGTRTCRGTGRLWKLISAFLLLGFAAPAQAQVPQLPTGARSRWVVEGPEEVVGYLTFDTATIHARVPRSLRLVTIGELASAGRSWAIAYLAAHPGHEDRGLSIVEIVHASRFAIDGREPNWPTHGAVALWFARAAWTGEPPVPGAGQPFLLLNLRVPDSSYVQFMRRRGYPAEVGRVWLERGEDGAVRGAVTVEGLTIAADCTPDGAVSGGPGSRGVQTFVPPEDSPIHSAITVAFTGHRIQGCREGAVWQLTGDHPMARGTFVGSSSFQWGYRLVGGTYPLVPSPLHRRWRPVPRRIRKRVNRQNTQSAWPWNRPNLVPTVRDGPGDETRAPAPRSAHPVVRSQPEALPPCKQESHVEPWTSHTALVDASAIHRSGAAPAGDGNQLYAGLRSG